MGVIILDKAQEIYVKHITLQKEPSFDLKKIKEVQKNKPKDCLQIGIIGELYTIMEPFANYELEKELASMNIEITRETNVRYLVFEKAKKIKKYLKYSKDYIKYKMG